MAKLKLTGKELRSIGYPEGPVISIAMNIMEKNFKHLSKEDALEILGSILQSPNQYAHDGQLGIIAAALQPKPRHDANEVAMNEKGIPFQVFGAEGIEPGALHQMHQAARLPVAHAGALMPDAHHGYGLPIGGVLATRNAVIPYGVGVDIGCRMCLSAYPLDGTFLHRHRSNLKQMLIENTCFGRETFKRPKEHQVLESNLFKEIAILKPLQGRAATQIGSSGGGNHFVEFGLVNLGEQN